MLASCQGRRGGCYCIQVAATRIELKAGYPITDRESNPNGEEQYIRTLGGGSSPG